MGDKIIWNISKLREWEKNPRLKGLLLGRGWNKGLGMSAEEKKLHRQDTLKRYNNKPERKAIVRIWHKTHPNRVQEIKQKYANSEVGHIKRRECGQRRMARERQLTKPINMDYFWWMCKRIGFKCLGCGKQCDIKTITVDHQLPINRGGDNDEWNLIPLCKSCNCRKQDRLLFIDSYVADIVYGDWLLCKQN